MGRAVEQIAVDVVRRIERLRVGQQHADLTADHNWDDEPLPTNRKRCRFGREDQPNRHSGFTHLVIDLSHVSGDAGVDLGNKLAADIRPDGLAIFGPLVHEGIIVAQDQEDHAALEMLAAGFQEIAQRQVLELRKRLPPDEQRLDGRGLGVLEDVVAVGNPVEHVWPRFRRSTTGRAEPRSAALR